MDYPGKINAPTFAYMTLYGEYPPEPLTGRTRGKKKIWRGLDVDAGLKDEWLEKLNNLPVEMRSSEEGKSADRPAFVIIRMPEDKDNLACDMTSALRRRDLITSYDTGQGNRPRICVVNKIVKGDSGWEDWWESLPDKISDAYNEIINKKEAISDHLRKLARRNTMYKAPVHDHLHTISNILNKISKKKPKIHKDDVYEAASALAKKIYKGKIDEKKVKQMAERAIGIAQKQKGDTEAAIGIVESFFQV